MSQRSQLSDVSGLIDDDQDLGEDSEDSHSSPHKQPMKDLEHYGMEDLGGTTDDLCDRPDVCPSPAPSANSHRNRQTNQNRNHNHRSPALLLNSPFSDPQFQVNHARLLSLSPRATAKTTNQLESFQINNNPSNNNQVAGASSRGTVRTPTTGASLGNQTTVTPSDHSEDVQSDNMSLSEMTPMRSVPKQTFAEIPENATVRQLNPGSLTPNVNSATHHASTPSPTEVMGRDDGDGDGNVNGNMSDHPSDEDIMPQMENQPLPRDGHNNISEMPGLSAVTFPQIGSPHGSRSPRQRGRQSSDPMPSPQRGSRSLNRRISPQRSTGTSIVRNPGDTHHFVLSLLEYRNRKEIGVAVIDLSSPRIFLYQFTDTATYNNIITLITTFCPKYILHPSASSNRSTGVVHCIVHKESIRDQRSELRPVQRNYFNDDEAKECLKEICTPESLAKVKCNLVDSSLFLALSACNAAMKWVNGNGPRFGPHTVSLEHRSIEGYMKLDFETIRNLELVANLRNPRSRRGTLLQALDHCKTKMGQRMLRSTLYQPLSDKAAIEERQKVVQILKEHEEFYNYIVSVLSTFNDQDAINNALSRTPRSAVTNFNADGASKFLLSVLAFQSNLRLLPGLVQALHAVQPLECNLLIRYHDRLADHEYANLLIAIGNTIDSEHEYSSKMSMQRQRNAVMTTVKTGISGELDTAKRLYYDVQSNVS